MSDFIPWYQLGRRTDKRMSFPRKTGVASKTYPRKALKSVTRRTEFGLDNHLSCRANHRILGILDLDIANDFEVCGGSEE